MDASISDSATCGKLSNYKQELEQDRDDRKEQEADDKEQEQWEAGQKQTDENSYQFRNLVVSTFLATLSYEFIADLHWE